MIATQYAEYCDIAPQGDAESDTAFRSRVAGELRKQGLIIEAHEAQQDERYESAMERGGDSLLMAGIMGAAALSMKGGYGKRGSDLVGDEIAAGVVSGTPNKMSGYSPEEIVLLLAMFG